MPRFYFNVIGASPEMDETGTELPSVHHAKREGVRFIGALLAEGSLTHHDGSVGLEVVDERGYPLFQLNVVSQDVPGRLAA